MARNHIRTFPISYIFLDLAIGMPGKKGVISGMRMNSEVIIEVNLSRAMTEGQVPFYIS